MAEYTNLICPVCNKAFSEDDNVVVCPVCGTPHHRECYQSLGHCANVGWHKENKFYDAEGEKAKLEGEKSREDREKREEERKNAPNAVCARCGFENDSQALFCSKCGYPVSNSMNNMNPQVPFGAGFSPFEAVSSEDETEGVKNWKLFALIRENQLRVFSNFRALSKGKRNISFNFAAFLFSPLYFFYRKMYGIGSIYLILMFVLNIPAYVLNFTNETLSEMLGMTVTTGLNLSAEQFAFFSNICFISTLLISLLNVFGAIFANRLYLNKCKKLAAKIDQTAKTREEFLAAADKKGGVNRVVILVFAVLYMLLAWAVSFIIMYPNLIGM